MIGLIAKKTGMSQVILDNGNVVPVTLLKVEPNVVTQVKSQDKEGYDAIQIGSGASKKYAKPLKGHLKELDAKILKEIRLPEASKDLKVGNKIDLNNFEVGDKVVVTGVSKGKGFAGTIKRHNFRSGPSGHGHDHHRQPGSIGAMGMPRVHKGKRMAGHMGVDTVTTKNVPIVLIDTKEKILAVKGSVPGANNNWVLIKKA